MLQPRLPVSRLARGLRRLPQRRFDSTHGPEHTPSPTPSSSAAAAPHPTTESFGWKFYAFFVTIPLVYFVAQDVHGATPENPPYLTRFIAQFLGPRRGQWEARNERLMDLVEQAAFDRALFQHADRPQNIETYRLSFPPILRCRSARPLPRHAAERGGPGNSYTGASKADIGGRKITAGSPRVRGAGHTANLEELMEHYRRKNREMDEKVLGKTPEQIYVAGGDAPKA